MEIIHRTDKNKDLIDFKLSKYDNKFKTYEKPALINMKNIVMSYLSEDERKLMEYKYVECLNTKQIADIMKVSQQAISEKLIKLAADVEKIIVKYIKLYNNKDKLSKFEYKVYEYYYLYRYNISEISKEVKKSRILVSNTIKIIEAKILK